MSEQENPETEEVKTFTEEIEIAGNQVVDRVKELVEEGNVRMLRIKSVDDKVFLEVPLTIGVLAGGVVALAAPMLALLGAFAALVTRAKIEIVREITDEEETEDLEVV